MAKRLCAIIGSGNIGTDLMIKILRGSELLEVAALIGIEKDSDGLKRAERMGVWTTHEGIDGLLKHPRFADIAVVFDATSAKAHLKHAAVLAPHAARGLRVVDLTPAAVGPYVVPVVNLAEHRSAPNVNMTTCGGQATIPIVHAVRQVGPVPYAEIVASIASLSAGPGTRANIDEFTVTTSRAIERVGGAARGKAIIVLNPADPPVFDAVELRRPGEEPATGTKVTVFLEVEGAGHYLPKYAGNLDIMTSAAKRVGEELARAG